MNLKTVKVYVYKLAVYIVAFFLAVTVNFFLPRLMPGSAISTLLVELEGAQGGFAASGTSSLFLQQEIKQLEVAFGLTPQPLPLQYLHYIEGIFTGNLGVSILFYPTPVAHVVFSSIGWSLGLVFVSSIIAFFLGSWLGAVGATRRRGKRDTTIVIAASILAAVPAFVILMYLEMGLSVNVGIFRISFPTSVGLNPKGIFNLVDFYTLPVIGLMLSLLSGFVLGMRNNMLHTLKDNYVFYAEALGFREGTVRKMVYRNSLLPNVTGFALSLGLAISSALTVEGLLSIPGAGYFFGLALTSKDLPLLQGFFFVIVLMLLISIAIVEVVYTAIDPRVRLGGR